MKTEKIRRKSLDEMIDEHIGIKGTKERDIFEEELRLDVLGQTIKEKLKVWSLITGTSFASIVPQYFWQLTVLPVSS